MAIVSILLPVYHARFLALTLDCLARQTFRDFEVIAIDDCSTDATAEILADFAARHAFFAVHRNSVNLMMPASVNRAAEFATGKYVCLLNHDDELDDRYLEHLVAVAEAHDADMTWSDFVEIDADGARLGKTHLDGWRDFIFQAPIQIFTPGELLAEILRRRFYPFTITNLIRRSLFEKIGRHDPTFLACPDAQVFMDVLLAARKVVYVNEPLFRYRRTATHLTASMYKSRQMPDEMEYLFVRNLRALSRYAENPRRFRRATYKDCARRLLSATKHRRYPTKRYWKMMIQRAPQVL